MKSAVPQQQSPWHLRGFLDFFWYCLILVDRAYFLFIWDKIKVKAYIDLQTWEVRNKFDLYNISAASP